MRRFVLSAGLGLALAAGPAGNQPSAQPSPFEGLPPRAQLPGTPPEGRAQPRPGPQPSPQAPPTKDEAKPDSARRASTLDDLFKRLAESKDEAEARGVARLIERRWSRSGSDTADLLMSRAGEAIAAKDYPLAVELLDRVLALRPRWAEAWNRRASAFYLLDDPVSAIADVRRVVEQEPRHFSAWAGLGHMLMASDDKRGALAAYRRALAIHPHLKTVRERVERLTPQVDGQDL